MVALLLRNVDTLSLSRSKRNDHPKHTVVTTPVCTPRRQLARTRLNEGRGSSTLVLLAFLFLKAKSLINENYSAETETICGRDSLSIRNLERPCCCAGDGVS